MRQSWRPLWRRIALFSATLNLDDSFSVRLLALYSSFAQKLLNLQDPFRGG
jgi:hypothetical protein